MLSSLLFNKEIRLLRKSVMKDRWKFLLVFFRGGMSVRGKKSYQFFQSNGVFFFFFLRGETAGQFHLSLLMAVFKENATQNELVPTEQVLQDKWWTFLNSELSEVIFCKVCCNRFWGWRAKKQWDIFFFFFLNSVKYFCVLVF